MKILKLNSAAVWTGVDAVGTTIMGIVLLQESANVVRLTNIGLVVVGRRRAEIVVPDSDNRMQNVPQ